MAYSVLHYRCGCGNILPNRITCPDCAAKTRAQIGPKPANPITMDEATSRVLKTLTRKPKESEVTIMNINLQRMWINQPSTNQPLHHLHGQRVLAHFEYDNVWKIYFLSGDVVSQQCSSQCLSLGWPKTESYV